jgi:hypothetical protein
MNTSLYFASGVTPEDAIAPGVRGLGLNALAEELMNRWRKKIEPRPHRGDSEPVTQSRKKSPFKL